MISDTAQSASLKVTGTVHRIDRATPYLAKIRTVHSDRNAVDVETVAGVIIKDVPVKTKAGLIDDEVYGELDLPTVGNRVIIQFLQNRESLPYVDGTIIPYLNNKYQTNQTPVNSGSKSYTTKLLEADKENYYRKIFKSGTTIEVDDDGTIVIETPKGGVIIINEDTEDIEITPSGSGEVHLKGDSKSLVTYSALNTALGNLVTAINALFGSKLDGGGTAGTLTLDISGAEAANVKTD